MICKPLRDTRRLAVLFAAEDIIRACRAASGTEWHASVTARVISERDREIVAPSRSWSRYNGIGETGTL